MLITQARFPLPLPLNNAPGPDPLFVKISWVVGSFFEQAGNTAFKAVGLGAALWFGSSIFLQQGIALSAIRSVRLFLYPMAKSGIFWVLGRGLREVAEM